ncbi:MAG: pyridoxamine 5'-phosphate oxidase family protein [Chitinophagaceae bacterium]|nr:pyridoxamine 5'-phosphate oxidase family protein [Chitinophagaceae bacterium]MCA6453095.1 pyridoxamine 5'-phosphate oxidase family protein [Chitinophagaceae bacterium]MCA6458070.1 pyridoxamine 5'-phosphate oxidase family protein [Chitinophagaceae bacterium]MCA6463783.1 pyridoxamine 5'-phosphate oxidase family protein [Chitinophagaceae bacterium]
MTVHIDNFILQQTAASICCLDDKGMPHCFSCFYAYNSKDHLLYYKSSADTRHSLHLRSNPHVAGTILPDKLQKLVVKGVQFEGELLSEEHELSKTAATQYYLQNPMAVAIPGIVWTIRLDQIKMTDSSFGFGKKIFWQRED